MAIITKTFAKAFVRDTALEITALNNTLVARYNKSANANDVGVATMVQTVDGKYALEITELITPLLSEAEIESLVENVEYPIDVPEDRLTEPPA